MKSEPINIPAAIATRFLDAWATRHVASDIATKLTCTEVDVLADLFTALGEPQAAAEWIDEHAAEDDPGDAHYRKPAPDTRDTHHPTR